MIPIPSVVLQNLESNTINQLFLILAGLLLLLSGCSSAGTPASCPQSDERLLEELICVMDSVNMALEEQDSATYERLMDEWFR